MNPKLILAGALGVLAATATAAPAHVTVQPSSATPGEYTVLDVRVPNEADDASTIRVDVKLPPGFASVSYQPVPGWRVKVTKEKLATPIRTDDGDITEGVTEVSFIGDRRAGKIPPGAFQDFPLSVRVPGRVGATLSFKAVQRYDDGETVRWIGAPGSDRPAPVLALVAAAGEDDAGGELPDGEAAAEGTTTAAAGPGAQTAAASAQDEQDGEDGHDGLALAALIVGGVGVVLGAGGLASGRRGADRRKAGA